ncbi:MAG: asparagine synthase (glutamine-hydrolyzing) [Bacteroidota bacterium]
MCGIAGIIYQQPSLNAIADIRKITELVAYRGPDGYGFWNKGNVYFGHRRLSIIDLTEAGAQPMEYNGYVITYNGEVYNYLELKASLEKLGYAFKTQCDTEVILAAYQCWGPGCLNRFNGMWSFAIYDPYKNLVFCSRDRFGVKPFYYLQQQDKLVFGSEIKQLLPFVQNVKANEQALIHYLAFSITDNADESFFAGIKNLPGSHYLTYDLLSFKIEIKRYYSISVDSQVQHMNYADALSEFKNHFNRSVALRMRSDTEVGGCLSGGLDSSLVALTVARNHKNETPFNAFTAASIDPLQNDAPFAKLVADSLQLNWHLTTPAASNVSHDFTAVCTIMEEPVVTPSVFMQHYVMQKANECGLKVLLDGQGADESLLGYSRYIGALARQLKGVDKWRFLWQAKQQYGLDKSQLAVSFFYFSNWQLRKKYALLKLKGINRRYLNQVDNDYFRQLSEAYKDPLELQKMEITSSQLPALLRYEDRNSMYFSIETRLPFLDWQLLEFNLSLPANFKIKNGWSKYPIRESLNGQLPDEITWRRNKIGFNAPDNIWVNAAKALQPGIKNSALLNQLFDNPLAVYNGKNGMLWKLANIACWEKTFNVTI